MEFVIWCLIDHWNLIIEIKMIFYKKQLGDFGEQLALKYLLNHNYQIITCHYQKRVGEIDIIACDPEKTLVFFEVKARTLDKFGQPEEAITPSKIRKLIKTAYWFLKENKLENQKFRLDVLAIKLDHEKKMAKIRHFRNITQ